MKIKVKIKTIGHLEHGPKRDGSGNWSARNLILEEDGSMYPDRFATRVSGEAAENFQWQEGTIALATISFSVREHNGNIYQDVYLKNLETLS